MTTTDATLVNSPPARPPVVRAVNLAGRALAALGVHRPALSLDALRTAAVRKAGHDDFGSDSYLPGLEALLHSLHYEARLNQLGRIVVAGQIVDALANRLTVVAWEKANPDLAAAPVPAPVVILGLGRTGTTILHETMAAAPGSRAPLQWEITDYRLAHSVTDSRTDKRVAKIDADIARTDKLVPGFSAIHFYDAHTPSECIGLTALDLCSEQFAALAWAPSYRRYLLAGDHHSVYEWHLRGLRYLQAGTPGVQWILKAPTHAAYLRELFGVYPDAKVINPHREPTEVIASLCSLYATLRRGFSDDVAVTEQAAADAAYAADIVGRAVAFRRDRPEVDDQICDVAFTRFLSDPAATLDQIHAELGLGFGADKRAAMLAYLRNRPREKYGRHRYALDDFGLDTDEVSALLEEYTRRFAGYF